jgi:hypothetical protein
LLQHADRYFSKALVSSLQFGLFIGMLRRACLIEAIIDRRY